MRRSTGFAKRSRKAAHLSVFVVMIVQGCGYDDDHYHYDYHPAWVAGVASLLLVFATVASMLARQLHLVGGTHAVLGQPGPQQTRVHAGE